MSVVQVAKDIERLLRPSPATHDPVIPLLSDEKRYRSHRELRNRKRQHDKTTGNSSHHASSTIGLSYNSFRSLPFRTRCSIARSLEVALAAPSIAAP